MKNTREVMLLLVKLQTVACNFTESSTTPWVFFTFLKIVQMVLNRANRHNNVFSIGETSPKQTLEIPKYSLSISYSC